MFSGDFAIEQTTITSDNLKQALKEALLEVLSEQPELLHVIVRETLEDIALAEAMKEGLQSEEVSREEVFQMLGELQHEG